ncbi:MAG TPA: CDP-alcohol phosphatidyltransferase family protein [Tissierellia bacterium]|nr:CDP-alcohol phosphatidyltransferase family protein [Tissierellia bacterium]
MKDRFKRENVLTLPNMISFFRLLLIPVFIWLAAIQKNYLASAVVFVVSFISDILDGLIARRTGAVSDLGKFLDPLADKLTQLVVMLILALRYPILWLLVVVFVIKEVLLFVLGLYVYKKTDTVNSAKWHGKLVTGLIALVMVILLILEDMSIQAVERLTTICLAAMVISFFLYLRFFFNKLRDKKNSDK